MAKSKKTRRFRGPKDRFARAVIDRLRRAGEAGQVHYDRGEFSLSRKGGDTLYLERLYKAYRDAPPEDREPLLERMLRFWFLDDGLLPGTVEEARRDLLPVLRSLDFLGRGTERKAGPASGHGAFRPFPGHMGVGLVVDLDGGMLHVTEGTLAAWGLDFEPALEEAKGNLRRGSAAAFKKVADGVWHSPWGDEYDSSRLLLPELLDGYEVPGDLVAMAPRRDVLLLTGTDHARGLNYLAHMGETCLDDARALCPVPLRRDGDSWLPYQPPAEHPAHLPLRLLRGRWIAGQYNSQMDRLNQGFRERGQKATAAPAGVKLHARERWADTLCDWAEGEELLLPRADLVRFCRGKDVLAEARWDRVLEVMGDALEPQGLCLERYRVRSFPTAEQLNQMCG